MSTEVDEGKVDAATIRPMRLADLPSLLKQWAEDGGPGADAVSLAHSFGLGRGDCLVIHREDVLIGFAMATRRPLAKGAGTLGIVHRTWVHSREPSTMHLLAMMRALAAHFAARKVTSIECHCSLPSYAIAPLHHQFGSERVVVL